LFTELIDSHDAFLRCRHSGLIVSLGPAMTIGFIASHP
jgi:hypothetical protein